MNRLRVFHLSGNVFPPLPAAHHTVRIWEELAKDADEYHIVASAGRLRYSHTQVGRIHLHLLPTLGRSSWAYSFSSWLTLFLALRHRPNRVVSQCPVHGGVAGAVFCTISRVPLFTEIHGSHYFFPVRPGLLGKLESAVYRLLSLPVLAASSTIRSLSSEMTRHLAKTYGKSIARKAVEIPNRVDLGEFSPAKSDYTIAGGPRIVAVGSYTPIKGHLQLMKDLFACHRDATLMLIGQGPLKDTYLEVARELGVLDRVRLTSARTPREVADLLAQADIYVHYSRAEGVSRALLEAMAMGLPVVCTPAGFLGGLLTHDRDVLILGNPGAEDLALALNRLTSSADLRARLGRAARATIERRFEWNEAFAAYREAIANCGLASTARITA